MAVDIELARKRFDQANSAETKQRERERADLSFYQGEGQWPSDIKTARKGQAAVAGQPAVPARPCLTINKVKDPVRHTINEFLQADLGISVIPADDFEGQPIDESEIELREGLVRRYQRQSQAEEARLWAASRAVISGRGFYGIMTRDIPGKTLDQEIYYRRFYNQFSVLLDPAHEQPDGSDAEFAFVSQDIPWHVYKAEYPETSDGKKNRAADDSVSNDEWRALGDEAPGWFTSDGDTRSVRVTEYWHFDRKPIEYVALEDGSVVEAAFLDKDALKTIPPDRRKREVKKQVIFAKIDGVNTLEETKWESPYIPIIKTLGEEMHPFDNERRSEGMVRPARDSQQGFNYMISAAVEMIGLGPRANVLGAKGQFEGLEQQWDISNTRSIGRLEYNPRTDETGGTILPPPQWINAEAPIQAMAAMMQAFSVTIKDTTGIPDPTLGNVDTNARSGKAIRAMLEQSLRGTSNYMANAIRSAHYEGRIVNSLLYPILMRKGRKVRMMTAGRNETQPVMLGQEFVIVNGQPVPYDPNVHAGQEPKLYKLTENAPLDIAIKVSKHFDTRRQEESAQLAELIGNEPNFMTWFGDIMFKMQDSPGHMELSQRAKAMLAPPIQKLLETGQPGDPEKQQMQQAMQEMQAELQRMEADKAAKVESAQIKAQSDAMQTQADNATKLEIEKIRAATALAVADLKATASQIIESARAEVEQFRLVIDQEHEIRLDAKQHAHEAAMAGAQHGHAAGLTAAEQEHEAARAEQDHGHALEQAEQTAALTPPEVETV